VFESQKIEDDIYKLSFTATYNNWGTYQKIPNNRFVMDKKGIAFWLEEPFDGDGTDDILVEILEPWLETHNFETNLDGQFEGVIREAYGQLAEVTYDDEKSLDEVIKMLVKAKTYIKK
jgi:hypothetical protein